MLKRKYQAQVQFAALPCRLSADGTREVVLMTSRETGRWVIPKGWPIKGLKPREVAAQEAWEEAGLRGRFAGKKPFGSFTYAKQLESDQLLCEVRVFLMLVEEQNAEWPEKMERQTQWFGAPEAAELVDEGGLSELIRLLI